MIFTLLTFYTKATALHHRLYELNIEPLRLIADVDSLVTAPMEVIVLIAIHDSLTKVSHDGGNQDYHGYLLNLMGDSIFSVAAFCTPRRDNS